MKFNVYTTKPREKHSPGWTLSNANTPREVKLAAELEHHEALETAKDYLKSGNAFTEVFLTDSDTCAVVKRFYGFTDISKIDTELKEIGAEFQREKKICEDIVNSEITFYRRQLMFRNDELHAMRMLEFTRWCKSNLKSLFLVRTVIVDHRKLVAMEITSEYDAAQLTARWGSNFTLPLPYEDEMIWGGAVKMGTGNKIEPSLAWRIGNKEFGDVHFADGLVKTQTIIVRKELVCVLAPQEDQRDVLKKYCEDYGAILHYTSNSIMSTMSNEPAFIAIVSMDNVTSFNEIWSSAIARFKEDYSINSKISRDQVDKLIRAGI